MSHLHRTSYKILSYLGSQLIGHWSCLYFPNEETKAQIIHIVFQHSFMCSERALWNSPALTAGDRATETGRVVVTYVAQGLGLQIEF